MISLLQAIALHQGGIEMESENDMLDEQIGDFAARLSAEETQLYYQILLQGRHDLNISPDQSLGFEMLMLRLLAFSPDAESTTQIIAEKKSL
jgi:DNA polymerase-3 subunit gamma/tau